MQVLDPGCISIHASSSEKALWTVQDDGRGIVVAGP
jgi:hypothetical protein